MSPPHYDGSRMMGCLFAMIAIVFVAIGTLAGVTGLLARATEGQEEVVQGLWARAFFSVLFALVAGIAAVRVYRRRAQSP